MNKVILIGRVTRDIGLVYSQGENHTGVSRFSLAVDRKVKTEGAQTADFISCLAFGKTAEFLNKYGKKGTKLAVEGRIQTGSYTNRDGQKVYTTDVVVESVEFAESKAAGSSAGSAQPQPQPQPSPVGDGFMQMPDDIGDELPFN